jgi:hypothetical protein
MAIDVEVIWVKSEREYFFETGLDRQVNDLPVRQTTPAPIMLAVRTVGVDGVGAICPRLAVNPK